ncbi:YfhO family protein [Arenibacter sp. GZD96]|uniref:YfhO family protein n=1 Tax=Aurantibrevibacter litoralis TaxID=3106030 RepID=UPI002AFE2B31|nr:YfhO family protein [Arenibacter sp. GZD-96]MEA1787466.1 YfhO family protein [Arenibacter sp. GZD-96]
MKNGIKVLFIHFFVVVFFGLAALAYFHPVLQGKVILQSDIEQFTGMAKEQIDFRIKTGEEPYWTNSAFGGMPTYQLGAYYPHNYIKKLDSYIRFLPRPADYLFLYFISFYILLCCLNVDYKLAIVGALAFGFSTYLIIILGVGHNAKAHALGYLPMLLGGIVLTFRKKYLWGFLLTAIAMGLEVSANHYQMTYYFMLLVFILGIVYLIDTIRHKTYAHFFKTIGILVIAVLLGIATNATAILTTKEYADWSTRGKSELTLQPNGAPKENTQGLEKAYITQYSYGITESLNLFVPRLFGGSNGEALGEDSKTFQFLINQGLPKSKALEFTGALPLYWGKQPGTAGPAYIGAIVFFLFVLGLFLVKESTKWWLLGGTVMSLVLSWGKNFGGLTDFMIDYFPLYDKFRAVSSIQVILELCAPILAILALVALGKTAIATAVKLRALKWSLAIVFGIGVLLIIAKGMFNFEAANDRMYLQYFGAEVMEMITLDRKTVYTNDIFRSLIFVFLAALPIWLFIKAKIKQPVLALLIGILIVVDLVGVNLRYVNSSDFVAQKRMTEPFPKTALVQQIQQDDGVFRVYNPSEGLNGAATSYYHQSIGGYHAAKPAGIQDLFDFHIYKNNIRVLNMLNVKYVIQEDEEGRSYPALNPNANGNAWFVSKLIAVANADEEIRALDSLDVQNEAVVQASRFSTLNRFDFQKDTLASIQLIDYKPNHLKYQSTNSNSGVAVFSEMYYPNGWNAYIDGVLTPHFKVNYTLRALQIPPGEHQIEFKFQPEIVATGAKISLISSLILGLLVVGVIGIAGKDLRKTN